MVEGVCGEVTPEVEAMPAALKKLARRLWEIQAEFFGFYAYPERYYCPFVDDVSDIRRVVEMSADIHELPITVT